MSSISRRAEPGRRRLRLGATGSGRRWVVIASCALGCGRESASSAVAEESVVVRRAPEPSARAAPPSPGATGGTPGVPSTSGSAPEEPLAATTAGLVEVKHDGPPRLLGAVRAARNAAFDRVVFEFADGVPGYHLEYVDQPVRDCGAGDVRTIEGDGWLEVRFNPAHAHTEEGQPTVKTAELRPGLPIVREVERTCDFEAVVTWVIGVSRPNRYRAFELKEPFRVVVDVEH